MSESDPKRSFDAGECYLRARELCDTEFGMTTEALPMWRTCSFVLGIIAISFTVGNAQERFDVQIRDNMFRGLAGNEAAFKSVMLTIEEKLAEDPDHAAALVWRGAGRYCSAGQLFRSGDIAAAQSMARAAMADIDRAYVLQPANIEVLIPRATVLLVAARNQRDSTQARNLAGRAAAAFESAFALRQVTFDQLGQHNRGEYLSGLAESWALGGERVKAEAYLRRTLSELPNTRYAERAAAKLADWNNRQPLNCQSCH